MTKQSLFNDLFPTKYKEDDFGYSQDWNNEIEKWLKCALETDEEIYNKQKNRIKKPKQRDELLSEYKAMYLVKNLWGVDDLNFTDEENATEKTADFIFNDSSDQKWFAEVKSPSWEAELAEDYKRGEITLEQFKTRKKQPQFINGEGRWMGFEIFRNPIIDALKKFKAENNNILFLCPNTFGPLELFGEMEEWHKLKTLVSELDVYQKISSICFLNINLHSDGFKYIHPVIEISKKPKLKF